MYRISQHRNVASVIYAVGSRFKSRLKKRISRTGLFSALKTRSHKAKKSSVNYVMSVCLSVCLSACSSVAPTGRIFMKFDIGDRKYFKKLHIWLKSDKVPHTLHDDASYVYILHGITKCFVVGQQCKGNRLFHFLGTSEHFCVVDSYI